jgi:hypothetical protein
MTTTKLITEPYMQQATRWPSTGRHILAQFDADSIIVYQAYRAETGHFAAQHGYFGDGFSLNRMSWIKPNFLWMMYRCGWGTKENQEVTLAIRLRRSNFEMILDAAVPSSFGESGYTSEADWKNAVERSDVRLQWDPDHHPSGAKLERRAIQLGLRGKLLAQYAHEWILDIEDISEFVAQQRDFVNQNNYESLVTPREAVYPIGQADLAEKLKLASSSISSEE